MTAKQVTKKASAAKPVVAKKAIAAKASAKPAKAAQANKNAVALIFIVFLLLNNVFLNSPPKFDCIFY